MAEDATPAPTALRNSRRPAEVLVFITALSPAGRRMEARRPAGECYGAGCLLATCSNWKSSHRFRGADPLDGFIGRFAYVCALPPGTLRAHRIDALRPCGSGQRRTSFIGA